jgi:hypothetical protein
MEICQVKINNTLTSRFAGSLRRPFLQVNGHFFGCDTLEGAGLA